MRKLRDFILYSIRGRIMASVILLHALLMGLVVADMVKRQQSFMESQIAGESQNLANALAANAPAWLLGNDLTALDELLESLKSVPHLQLALILDASGKVRATTDAGLFNLVLDDAPSRQLLASGKQLWHDGMVDSIAAIRVDDKTIGHARVILNASPVQAELDAIIRKGMLYTALAIFMGGLLVWLLVRGMTQRLENLSAAADAIAGGDLGISLPDASGRDEVARLSRDFNQMARALEQDQEQRRRHEASLFAEKERAWVTLQSIGDAVITTDTQCQVEFLNPVAERLTGWRSDEAYGKPLEEVFRIVGEGSRTPLFNTAESALRRNSIVGLPPQTVLIRRDGREFFIEGSAAPTHDPGGAAIGVVLAFNDHTQSQIMAREITYQASHDALTGLVNRREFEHRLDALVSNALSEHHQHALLYLDLDQFKLVNDTCGHAAGDEMLRQITLLLQAKVRDSDMLARLGGDEFGVLLAKCPLHQARIVAEKLIETIRNFHFHWGEKTFTVGVSIGLAAITEHSGDWVSLLSNADTACYFAKEHGRNRCQIYNAEDAELARRHDEMHWVGRIAKAFEEERFVLYQQLIAPVTPDTESMPHFEILVRLRDENGELVPPGNFIPAAERYNLMNALDRWVIGAALDWFAARRELPMICAINLSGQSLGNDDFLGFVITRIQDAGVDPARICFEITETAAIANLASAIRFIGELKILGCRFALDDFGAGLSSFAYLKNLPVDYLKIDGGFVKDMTRNETSLAMVEAINNIGHTLHIQTIAEFVENEEILDRLKWLGVDFAQGYGIAKPAPLADFQPRLTPRAE